MGGQNQDDIDALLGSLDADPTADENPSDLQSDGDDPFAPVGAQDTGDSPEVQAEELPDSPDLGGTSEPSGEKTRSGKPWVDFIPEDIRPKPQTLDQRLGRAIEDADAEFAEMEALVRDWYIGSRVHTAYYKNWIFHGNRLLRNQVIFRMRRAQILAAQKRKAALEAQSEPVKAEAS